MKYRIFPFMLGIMLAGCNGKHGSGDQTAITKIDSNDTLTVKDTMTRHHGLFDSIREPILLKLVSKDSIELLSVKHAMSDTYHVEQILYMDHHKMLQDTVSPNAKYMGLRKGNYPLPDGMPMLSNPFPEINGTYLTLFKYKGKYLITDIDEGLASFEMVICDSGILNLAMMPDIMLYQKGEKQGDKIVYTVAENLQNIHRIEVKRLSGNSGLIVWKRYSLSSNDKSEYFLLVPSGKVSAYQFLRADNNLGVASNMDVDFDPINYDSLFNSK